jgi:hypothetical protein
MRQETLNREAPAPLEDILSWPTIVIAVLVTTAIAGVLVFVALHY